MENWVGMFFILTFYLEFDIASIGSVEKPSNIRSDKDGKIYFLPRL